MGLIENLVALFSSWYEEEAEPSRYSSTESSNSAESSSSAPASTSFPAAGVTSSNNNNNMSKKKIAQKLQGYFELGKEEINKAITAEEWGLCGCPFERLI